MPASATSVPAPLRRERLVAALNLAVVLVFMAYVLDHHGIAFASFAALLSGYLQMTIVLAFAAIVCFAGWQLGRAGVASGWAGAPAQATGAALRYRLREGGLFTLLWPMLSFPLLMASYNTFKQRILPQAGFHFDARLAAIDRRLFGVDPGLWLHEKIGGPAVTYMLDTIYHAWFFPMAIGVALVALCAGSRTRAQYMTAYVGIWILLGAVGAYLVPAAGPCFYDALVGPVGAEPFVRINHILATHQAANGEMLSSVQIKQMLLISYNSPVLTMGGGISGMPSVHNALAVLFALASFRINRTVGLLMSGYAVLIAIGSVYLNWHYAIDSIAGALAAIVIWLAAGRLVDGLLYGRWLAASWRAPVLAAPVAVSPG